MNSDSYGYLALIYRLRAKQWETYLESVDGEESERLGVKERLRFRKNTALPLKDDWLGAPQPSPPPEP
jgi:hypothetical protein